MADVADEQPSRRVRHAFLALNLRHRVYWENLRNLWEIIPSHQSLGPFRGVPLSRGDIGGKGRLKMKRLIPLRLNLSAGSQTCPRKMEDVPSKQPRNESISEVPSDPLVV